LFFLEWHGSCYLTLAKKFDVVHKITVMSSRNMPTVCLHLPCLHDFAGGKSLVKLDIEEDKDTDREAAVYACGCGCDPPSRVCAALSVCEVMAGVRGDERVEPYVFTMGRNPFLKGRYVQTLYCHRVPEMQKEWNDSRFCFTIEAHVQEHAISCGCEKWRLSALSTGDRQIIAPLLSLDSGL
jgi:hypothetical protein